MVTLVSIETVLLVLLVVLVAGLLRSHATILRRLGPEESEPQPLPAPPVSGRGAAERRAPDLVGLTPAGDTIKLAFERGAVGPTLLAFLSTGCSSCSGFWEALADRPQPQGVQTVVVTHGSDRERPPRLRSLAPEGLPVVMSSEAWEDYKVPGSPYFVLIDGMIRGEGVATTWQALTSLVADAIDDQREAEQLSAGSRRARSVEETLAAGGIGSDHPSLYPGWPAADHST